MMNAGDSADDADAKNKTPSDVLPFPMAPTGGAAEMKAASQAVSDGSKASDNLRAADTPLLFSSDDDCLGGSVGSLHSSVCPSIHRPKRSAAPAAGRGRDMPVRDRADHATASVRDSEPEGAARNFVDGGVDAGNHRVEPVRRVDGDAQFVAAAMVPDNAVRRHSPLQDAVCYPTSTTAALRGLHAPGKPRRGLHLSRPSFPCIICKRNFKSRSERQIHYGFMHR